MIKFFFNRFSKVVLFMEAVGIAAVAIASVRLASLGMGAEVKALLGLVVFEYAFIRFCASFRWYKDAPRWSGIELQFKRSLAPASYILAIVGALLFLPARILSLSCAAILLALIAHVNVILLYFHFRDRDPAPANFYSSGAFLINKKGPQV